MGSLTGNPANLASFTGQSFPNGLDLNRCVIQFDVGVFSADPTATFLQGQLVSMGSAGITQAGGTNVLGVAKWNKSNTLYAAAVDEPIVLTATDTLGLKHANVSNVSVRAAAGVSGTALSSTNDYQVISATNGTIARRNGGAITSGDTVYVTYTWALQSSDLDFQGRNFWNFTDDVSIQANAVTVITAWNILFTTQYDTAQTYALTSTGSNLYCGSSTQAGLFTSVSTSHDFVGRVLQLPTATDPYMGIVFGGQPVAQS